MRHDWTLAEIRDIHETPLLDLIHRAAEIHRRYHDPQDVQLCHLMSIKTGGCSEDCKYCAQSSRYQTPIKAEPMMSVEEVVCQARQAKERGATRICLGAAWRQVRNSQQFERVLQMVKEISAMGLEVCCTLGMLSEKEAKRLKEAGLYAYNHNLDTSDRYYKEVISTRSYMDRLHTLGHVRQAGMTVCCGGIIGMGETVEDRLRLLQTLSSFQPHPESVPINRLVPIPGTPMGDQKITDIWEMIRMIATARIVMPKSRVRLAAGRLEMTESEQSLCYLAGANSIFFGEKLLTTPNPDADQDMQLLERLGLNKKKKLPKIVLGEDFMKAALERRKEESNLRKLPVSDALIDLTSNDYLGYARSSSLSKKIEREYQTLIQEGGIRPHLGATGSRLLTGNRPYAEALEKQIASFHSADSALLYNSGYVANIGLLSSVANQDDTIIFDSQVHASTWDGAHLSRARLRIYRHNDLNHLEKQLQRRKGKTFVCIESLYSMEGDVAPLNAICDLCQQYGALLIVDEAHATGVIGKHGEGLVASCGEQERVFARVHTFGKALGTHGAAVLGSETLKNYLVNFSRPFIYTTAFPLHTLVSIKCVYDHLAYSSGERQQLQHLIAYFKKRMKDSLLPIRTTDTPIQTIRVPGNKEASALSKTMRERGLDVRAIKSPTVRRGKESLRVCLHAFNTPAHIDQLIHVLAAQAQEFFVA